jgi:pyruvate-formate lyase
MFKEAIMNERVQRLKKRLEVDKYPICTEKARIIMYTCIQAEGEPVIVRRAMATANYLDKKTIFIENDELIVGNIASKPMGMEAGSLGPTWPQEDLEDLKKGNLLISD